MILRVIAWAAAAVMAMRMCAGAETAESGRMYAVQLAERAYLVDAKGNRAGDEQYRLIYELTGAEDEIQLFAGETAEEGKAGYALVNGAGERLTGFDYQTLEYSAGQVLFMKNGRWGVMDADGGVLAEAAYTALVSNGEGGFLAQKTDPYDDSPDDVYLIGGDYTARETGVKMISGLSTLSDGLMPAVSAENGLYGYLGPDGTWAIAPEYRWAGMFEDGYAHVSAERAGGLIDRTGSWALAPEYGYISYEGTDSMIAAVKGEKMLVIDPETFETAAEFGTEETAGYALERGGAVISQPDGVYFVGMDGEAIRLDGCRGVNQWGGMEDRMIVQAGEFGTPAIYLYDLKGNRLAGPYQDVMPLGQKDGEMYYVFTSFEAVQTEYGEGLVFWDEAPGTRKCGVLSPEGTQLCAFDAEYISCAGEGRMLIQQDGAAAFADFEGNIYAHFGEEAAEGEYE